MEALLLLGVAATGYELARRQEARQLRHDAARGGLQIDRLRAEAAEVEARHYNMAADPRASGVFDPLSGPNMVPIPRNTAPMPATERFTAPDSTTGVWRHKRESAPRFDPSESAVRVSFSGSGGNPYSRLREPTVSGTMNNVSPTERIRVGKGVGYGPNVPAADGFHPFYRTLPSNVGVYRKNNLPGGFVPGKSPVDFRESQFYIVDAYKPPKFFDLKRRPLGPNMARVTAPTSHAKFPREICMGRKRHDLSEAYYGNPNMVNGVEGANTSHENAEATRFTNERTARSGTDVIAPGTNVPGPGVGKADVHYDEGRFEGLHSYEGDRLGGPVEQFVKVGAGAVGKEAPQPTLRETTTARPYGHFLGIAAPTGHFVQQGPLTQNTSKQLDRHAKRGDQLVKDWVPMGRLKRPDTLTYGIFGDRNKEKGGRLMGAPQVYGYSAIGVKKGSPGMSTIRQLKLLGLINDLKARSSRASVVNPRVQDLDLAANQLQSNFANFTFSRPR